MQQTLQRRPSQVGVHQQHLLPRLREDHGQIRSRQTLTLTRARARYQERAPRTVNLREVDIGPQHAVRFRWRAFRRRYRHQLVSGDLQHRHHAQELDIRIVRQVLRAVERVVERLQQQCHHQPTEQAQSQSEQRHPTKSRSHLVRSHRPVYHRRAALLDLLSQLALLQLNQECPIRAPSQRDLAFQACNRG